MSSELGSLGFEVLLGCSRGTGTMPAPAREIHRRDHTSKEEKGNQIIAYRCNIICWRVMRKVQSDLKQRFITLAWPELQNPPCSGHFEIFALRASIRCCIGKQLCCCIFPPCSYDPSCVSRERGLAWCLCLGSIPAAPQTQGIRALNLRVSYHACQLLSEL